VIRISESAAPSVFSPLTQDTEAEVEVAAKLSKLLRRKLLGGKADIPELRHDHLTSAAMDV